LLACPLVRSSVSLTDEIDEIDKIDEHQKARPAPILYIPPTRVIQNKKSPPSYFQNKLKNRTVPFSNYIRSREIMTSEDVTPKDPKVTF
jgi:hypothetical protein